MRWAEAQAGSSALPSIVIASPVQRHSNAGAAPSGAAVAAAALSKANTNNESAASPIATNEIARRRMEDLNPGPTLHPSNIVTHWGETSPDAGVFAACQGGGRG